MQRPGKSKAPGKKESNQAQTGNKLKGKAAGNPKNLTSQTQDERGSDEMRQGHISGTQFMMLLTFLLGTKVLFLFPTQVSLQAGSSAWLAVTISTGISLIGLWGWILWIKTTAGSGFVVSLRRTCGRVPGDMVAAAVLFIFIAVGSWNMRLFVGGAVIGIVPEFPLDPLIAIMVASSIYAAWLGLESVARAAMFFFYPTLISLAAVIASLYHTFHLQNLLPFWGLGVKATLQTGILGVGTFGAISAVGILKSYVRNQDEIARQSVYGTVAAALILVVGVVALAGIFPYPMSTRKVEPFGVMARSVYLGRFLQRLEALFTFTWFFTTAVQASFNYILVLTLTAQLSNCGTYRPFVPGIAVLTFGMAGIPANTLRAAQLVSAYLVTTGGNALVALGWVLYVVARVRGIKPKQSRRSPADGGAQQPDVSGQKATPQAK